MEQTRLFTDLIQEADEAGSYLPLDFTNEKHFRFFMEQAGGTNVVENTSPELFELLQTQRRGLVAAEEKNSYGLTNATYFKDMAVEQKMGEAGSTWRVSVKVVTNLCSNTEVPSLINYLSIYDETAKNVLYEDPNQKTEGKNNEFVQKIFCDTTEQGIAKHLLRFYCLNGALVQNEGGEAAMCASVSTTQVYVQSVVDDVKEVKVIDPIIKHPKRAIHSDRACISYKRTDSMPFADYEAEEGLPHGVTDMPVHFPFKISVELQNNAYFEQFGKNGYFDPEFAPRITLSRFSSKGVSLTGAAVLKQLWAEVSDNNIKLISYNKNSKQEDIKTEPNKIEIAFPDKWNSTLTSDEVMDIGTEAELYAYIPLRTVNTSNGQANHNATPIIVQYEAQAQKSQAKVARLYFQWGCIARDTLLLTPSGEVRAEEVHIGDLLLTPEGLVRTVCKVVTGLEKKLLVIEAAGHRLRVSHLHTLCLVGSDGTMRPVAACDAKQGDEVMVWKQAAGKTESAVIESIYWEDYNDRVYNFMFEEETWLVGDGFLIGDQALQGRYPPIKYTQSLQQPTQRNLALSAQLYRLFGSAAYPQFKSSDQPESYAMHYFAVKYLLVKNLFPLGVAQTIAEYCQFLADNATNGGLLVNNIPEWLNATGFYWEVDGSAAEGEYRFGVPIIPSAMEKWYDTKEMDARKPWFPKGATSEQSYDVTADILRPIHFFPGETDFGKEEALKQRVVPNPERLRDKMQALAAEIKVYKDNLDQMPETLMLKTGIYLHVLVDTILHQNFSAQRSWINMSYRESAEYLDGKPVREKKYLPQRTDFDDNAMYSVAAEYPAALEKIGWLPNGVFFQLSYQFPTATAGMGHQSVRAFWDNYASPNNGTYAIDLEAVNDFLCACVGTPRVDNWRKSERCKTIRDKFACTETDFDKLAEEWKKNETDNMKFNYDAPTVYTRLLTGTPEADNDEERYALFFTYTQVLYHLQHLWDKE